MGSSCEPNGQNIDSTVGGLVWVRRRNGSWWPGRILGPDELPGSCLPASRRPGTPVKLLGREDGHVDWYNLEKSKRVKAFRCGEYDNCIEKAKITAKFSCKRGVYARREDAILQALEIENSQLSKNNNPETISQTGKTESISDKLSGLDLISVSPQELSRPAASADNSLDGIRQQIPNDSDDDGTEGSKKRMRGLQDLGVGRIASSYKKKRTRVAHVHDFLKKKNRRCQLTKVLKKTEMVSIPVICEEFTGLNGPGCPNAKVWGKEYNELKGSFFDSTGDVANNINSSRCKQKKHETSVISELLEIDDSSGRLFDVPFVREEKQTAGSSPANLVPETGQVGTRRQSGKSSLAETILVGPDEFQESGSISSGADISHIMDKNGTSKWQHKGKRKSRNKSKTKTMRSFLNPDDESREVSNTTEVTGPQRLMFMHQSCSTLNPKYKVLDLAYKKTDTGSLYDVNIDVLSGNFPRHHPYISLLSNFTGQTMTGYSLEVEVLNDAVSDLSLNSPECLSSGCELGGFTMVYGDPNMVPEASKKTRKNGLLSNKKIRTLSSLTGCKIPSEKGILKRPDLACVPLKVVFGRINAALGISSADEGFIR